MQARKRIGLFHANHQSITLRIDCRLWLRLNDTACQKRSANYNQNLAS